MTFFEFQKRFPTETAALNFIVATKYANDYYCPKCGCYHKGIYRSSKRTKILHCNNCMSEFSVLAGTIFEGLDLETLKELKAEGLTLEDLIAMRDSISTYAGDKGYGDTALGVAS